MTRCAGRTKLLPAAGINAGVAEKVNRRRFKSERRNVTTTNAPAGVEFKEGFVEADGFRIRYLESGSGDAHVIIHGGGGVQQYYSHDELAKKRRVVLLEVPGFGNSPANDRTQSMAELGNTMAEAIANLGIER